MATVEYWLNKLELQHKDKALTNYKKFQGEINGRKYTESNSIHGAISVAFSWNMSPEGWEYWMEVYNYYESQ